MVIDQDGLTGLFIAYELEIIRNNIAVVGKTRCTIAFRGW